MDPDRSSLSEAVPQIEEFACVPVDVSEISGTVGNDVRDYGKGCQHDQNSADSVCPLPSKSEEHLHHCGSTEENCNEQYRISP
jgi:hypothetical protein